MKTLKRVLFFVFLTGMILGAGQPALLYASEGEHPVWEQWLDTSSFTGTKLAGPLSIYYEYLPGQYCNGPGQDGSQVVNMYVTVQLSKGFDLHTFQGKTQNCIGSINSPGGQGDWIVNTFLDNAVRTLYGPSAQWKLKSIDNAQFNDQTINGQSSRAFVADIQIAVAVK